MRQLTEEYTTPGRVLNTLPTIGFTVREVILRGVAITLFDVGGQAKIRELWPQYCHAADALVVVVDSNDQERLPVVREELRKLMATPTKLGNAAILVLANKQDQPLALAPDELVIRLGFHPTQMQWHIQGTVGIDGTGVAAGVDWLAASLGAKHRPLPMPMPFWSGCFRAGAQSTEDITLEPVSSAKLDGLLPHEVSGLRRSNELLTAEVAQLRATNRKLIAQLTAAGIRPQLAGDSAMGPVPLAPLAALELAPAAQTLPPASKPSPSRSSLLPPEQGTPAAGSTPRPVPSPAASSLGSGRASNGTGPGSGSGSGERIGAGEREEPSGGKTGASSGSPRTSWQGRRGETELPGANEGCRAQIDGLLATNAELSILASASAQLAEQLGRRAVGAEAQLDDEREEAAARLQEAIQRAEKLAREVMVLRATVGQTVGQKIDRSSKMPVRGGCGRRG